MQGATGQLVSDRSPSDAERIKLAPMHETFLRSRCLRQPRVQPPCDLQNVTNPNRSLKVSRSRRLSPNNAKNSRAAAKIVT
jgi:hypothetical protein